MKRFKDLRPLREDYDAKEMEIANKTSRSAGAVSSKALVPRHIEQHGNKEHEHLDFGAGKDAVHAKNLREKGFKVTAHEFGSNQKEGVHDPKALDKTYHHVYASNVLNVQSSHHMLGKTLDQIHKATKPGGHFTGNLPESPRKFPELNHELVHHELKKRFHDVKVVGGTKKAPVYHATGPKEKIDEEVQIDEVSMETLTSYKKKAGEQASAMNKAVGEVAKSSAAPEHKKAAIDALVQKGNKRFSGIIQATKKQFAKSVKEEVQEELQEQKHLVSVTVSDPNHSMVSKRNDTIQKRVKVTAKDKENAISSGIAFYKKKGYKVHDHNYIGLHTEEVEELDELNKSTLGSYIKKASSSGVSHGRSAGVELGVGAGKRKDAYNKEEDKAEKRLSGIRKATDRLTKEEVEELDEVNYAGWSFDDLHKHLKKNGWDLDRSTGHKQYVHPKSARPIAVPHKHGKTVAPGTVRNIHQKMKEFIQEADESGSQQDNLTLASRTFKEKPNKEPMHKYDKEKIQEANYLVTVQHHDENGEKGQRTHKIYNVTDPVRPELHAKNIAMMRHKKWAVENGVKLNQYMPIETKKLDESRKLEIIKEVVKKKNETKLKTGDKFQPEPVLSSTVVKET